MKVLFVSSGKSGRVSILIENQANSLTEMGIEIDFFLIQGKGIVGYLKSLKNIRRTYSNGNYSLIHAHYSYSAYAASLVGRFPLVVSLMGSDAYSSFINRVLIRVFSRISWDKTIVKTQRMKELVGIKKAFVIPNGVNTDVFCSIPKEIAKKKIGYKKTKKIIVFIADPNRSEKNYRLAIQAVRVINYIKVELMPIYNTPSEKIPLYLNAADVLLLTSKWEGGVNVIKEAMACNLPIVSTDVGDVKLNIENVAGCYICEENANSLAEGLIKSLDFSNRTNGREQIFKKGLDSATIAKKIVSVYESVSGK